jgi:hypothetical protein
MEFPNTSKNLKLKIEIFPVIKAIRSSGIKISLKYFGHLNNIAAFRCEPLF